MNQETYTTATIDHTNVDLGRFTSGQQLVNKVLWDIQLGLRKFITTAEIVMENEIWQDDIPQETISWLKEWYPQVKHWVDELREIDKYQISNPRATLHWADLLFAVGEEPGLTDLLDSAPERLPDQIDEDTVGYCVANQLLRLRPLKRDLQDKNYARLWQVQY